MPEYNEARISAHRELFVDEETATEVEYDPYNETELDSEVVPELNFERYN